MRQFYVQTISNVQKSGQGDTVGMCATLDVI